MALTKVTYAMIETAPINVVDYGAVGDGVTDDTVAVNAALAAMTSNSSLVFPPGQYLIDGVLQSSTSISGLTDIAIIGYGANLIQKVETTSARTSILKCLINIQGCTNVAVKGFNLKGNHLNNGAGTDNCYQCGVYVYNSTNVIVSDCYAEEFNTAYRAQASTGITFESSKAKTTYQSFVFTLGCNNCFANGCYSDGAHYNPLGVASGIDGNSTSGGYGFLSADSTNIIFNGCTSEKSGFDCFRSQHSTGLAVVGNQVINCISSNARRHGFSTYSGGNYCTYNGGFILKCGNTGIWNSSSNYFLPHSFVSNIVVSGNQNIVSGVNVIQATGTTGFGVQITSGANNTKIDNCYMNLYDAFGIGGQAGAGPMTITNNTFTNAIMPTTTSRYGISLPSTAANSIVSNNSLNYFIIGIASDSENSTITGNKVTFAYNYGIYIAGEGNILSGNSVENANMQPASFFPSIYVLANNTVLGVNTVTDTQGSPTIYKALKIGSVTGTIVGPVTEIGSSTGVIRTGTVADDGTPLYTVSASQSNSTAASVGDLVTDFNALLAKLRAAGLMTS